MDWGQVVSILSLFLANAGLIIWFRAESRADWRHMDTKLDIAIKSMDNKLDIALKAIQEEMKDFHGRLCAIEEKNKSK